MQPRKHLLATCSVLLVAALLAACPAPAAAPAPPADTPAPPAAESDPVAVVQAWVDALNSGDTDAALDLFTEDSRYRMHYTANNKDELRWVFTWLTGLETEFEVLDCQPQDNKAECSLAVTDGCIAISASPTLPIKSTFTVQDGKIKEVAGSGTGPEWNAYWNFVPVVQSWERVFRPEDYAYYTKNEGTYEAGKVAIKLCREYENIVKTQEPATAAAAQGLVNAINSGDTDAALPLFTQSDETKFRVMSDEAVGADQMGAMFDYLAGKEAQLQITDCEWQGISTQCAVSLVDGCIAVSGVPDGLHGKMTFYSEEDGTLRQVVVVPAAAERKTFEAWLEAEAAWASADRAEDLAQAEGYSQAAGAMAVRLCREYAAAPKLDAVNVETGYAEVNGTRLFYEMAGAGEPVVMIHGLGWDTRSWDNQFAELAQQYQVIRYDMRGFGQSDMPTDQPYAHADDLKALLEYLEIDAAHIFGHSFGGEIALNFALTYPEATRSLVLIEPDIQGAQGLPDMTPEEEASFAAVFEALDKGDNAAAGLAIVDMHPLVAVSRNVPGVRELILQVFTDYQWWQFLNEDPVVQPDPPPAERIGDIAVPTLLVVGDATTEYQKIEVDRLAEQVPNAEKVVFENSDHFPHLLYPQEFNESVLDFLAKVSARQ